MAVDALQEYLKSMKQDYSKLVKESNSNIQQLKDEIRRLVKVHHKQIENKIINQKQDS